MEDMLDTWKDNITMATSVEWNVPLGQCKKFNLLKPNFDLSASSINLGLTLETDVAFELCWSFDMTLGYGNATGFFMDVTKDQDLTYVHPMCKGREPLQSLLDV